jgi:hypothetical protein
VPSLVRDLAVSLFELAGHCVQALKLFSVDGCACALAKVRTTREQSLCDGKRVSGSGGVGALHVLDVLVKGLESYTCVALRAYLWLVYRTRLHCLRTERLQLAIVIQVDVLSLGLHGNQTVGASRRR